MNRQPPEHQLHTPAQDLEPQPMTGAELDTLRRICGWEREDLAELCEVQTRTIKHWQSGRAAVPVQVAQLVRSHVTWLQDLTERTLRQYAGVLELARSGGAGEPLEVVLLRYRERSHIASMAADDTLTPATHAALAARVMLALQAQGVEVRVVWFDPQAFGDWAHREGASDTPASRAAWAAGDGLGEQLRAYGSEWA